MINFSLDVKQFQREVENYITRQDNRFKKAIFSATLDMHRFAKKKVRNYTRNSKVRSSTLINNIQLQITNIGLTGVVMSKASYSRAFEEGTRPHLITIRKKKVLAGPKRGAPAGWKSFSGDYAIYGTKVVHPGTQPKPFMYPAWRFGIRSLDNKIKAALK